MLGVLLSKPSIVVNPLFTESAVMTGKFCWLFAPVSLSPGSLSVTPSLFRSMPRSPFE